MNDIFVKGAWAGLVGTLFGDELIHVIAYFILHTSTTTHYIASLIFHIRCLQGFLPLFVALLVHIGAGAFIGIGLALIFKYFGDNYAYIKGISWGFAMWIVHIVVIPNIITTPQQYVIRTPMESMVDLVAHLSYAVLTTTVLFNKRPRKNANSPAPK